MIRDFRFGAAIGILFMGQSATASAAKNASINDTFLSYVKQAASEYTQMRELLLSFRVATASLARPSGTSGIVERQLTDLRRRSKGRASAILQERARIHRRLAGG